MGDPLSARLLLLLTLLGLAGCSLIATLHPPQTFDPGRVAEQAGRNVSVRVEVATAAASGDWLRGEAYPVAGHAAPARIAWIWFRPPASGPLPGDRLVGHAQVSVDARGTALILDGENAARIEPGPHPVPVHWSDLVAAPERLAGRLLVVNGALDGEVLRAPDGASRCALAAPAPDSAWGRERHQVRLERSPGAPGWVCRVEA